MATKAKKEVAATTKKDAKKVIKKVEVKEPKAKAPKKEAVKKEPKTVKAVPVKEVSKKVVVKKTPKVVEKAEVATSLEVSSEAETPKAEKVVKKEVSKSATTVEELFEAGAHFGHVVKKWNPKMKKYLWGAMNGIHIFDLEQTVSGLNEATKALTELAGSGKRVVLVGTKRQVRQMVEEEAKRLNIPYITQRWIGGLITNWKQVKQLKRETGQLKKYTKKEQVLFDKEIARLERIIGGISALKEAPEVVVVFDTHKEKLAVKEASSRNITVVGIVDSNANPDLVDYIVPMNDDSAKGLEIVVRVFGHAIENGLKSRKEVSK